MENVFENVWEPCIRCLSAPVVVNRGTLTYEGSNRRLIRTIYRFRECIRCTAEVVSWTRPTTAFSHGHYDAPHLYRIQAKQIYS